MKNKQGYSLVELMVALAIFSIVMTGIYRTYHYQQSAYIKQGHITEMQQQMRAAQFFLTQELRMAGFDRSGDAEAAIMTATSSEIKFSADLNVDGDMDSASGLADDGEIIRFALSEDTDGDGISDGIVQSSSWKDDGTVCSLGREYFTRTGTTDTGGGLQPVAENVEAIEFCYVLADGTETIAPTAAELEEIRTVIVSALLRVRNRVKGYRDSKTYVPAAADAGMTPDLRETRPAAWGPFDDSYVRRLAVIKVKCRNLSMSPV